MAVIWSLYASFGIIALRVRDHSIQGGTHDLSKELADLVLGVLVFGGELQDLGESGLV